MKKALLFFSFIFVFAANAQNGFTTYSTNISITGAIKTLKTFLSASNGDKWFGFNTVAGAANAGLLKYNNGSWTLFNKTSTPRFPSHNVTALAEDSFGNIWIGTGDSGLVKYDGLTFVVYKVINGLPTNAILSIETKGNQIYVGTAAGLSRFDGTNFINYNVANGLLPTDTIASIKAESANLIWLGGFNKLVEFNINSSFTTSNYVSHIVPQTAFQPDGLYSAGLIRCIYIDSQSEKWLGTTSAGIVRYSGSVFQNANVVYDLYGSSIPPGVIDITTGLHNGILFSHSPGGTSPNSFSGLTELAPNNIIYQYFYPISTQNIGSLVENDGTNILISTSGPYSSPNVYRRFDSSYYKAPLNCVNVNNFKSLDINNIKAGISNRGDMHSDIAGSKRALYEVPKGSGKNSSYASALWIRGFDNANVSYGAAQTYRQNGNDFWPGPLDTINGSIDTITTVKYDKIWKVSYTDINTFITAFSSGSVVATPDMLSWPAHGSGNNSKNLAPFVDHNGDGIYNPYDGDYPKIKGDQALYFIFNDNLGVHSTSMTPMGVEVQGMAYAYGCPTSLSNRDELAYTTFYDYKIINRSVRNYHDVYVGMFNDADIGSYNDDYIGCNVSENYGFGYNGHSYDIVYGSYMPAQGYHILKGPKAYVSDGVDNNNDGVIDEANEECKMNYFRYFNGSPAATAPMSEPTLWWEFYYYMNSGYWKDNTPFTCGGNGYGGTVNTRWAYTGDPNISGVNTDPNNTCGYWVENSSYGDRKTVMTSGPFNLASGQMQEVEYAFVTSFDSTIIGDNLLPLAKLKTDIQKINAFYNQVNKPNCLQSITVGITEVPLQNDFSLYPNPAKSIITITSTINGTVKMNYEIVDVLGKVVLSSDHTGSDKFSVNINDLNSGIYFLRLQVNNSVVVKKFVKE